MSLSLLNTHVLDRITFYILYNNIIEKCTCCFRLNTLERASMYEQTWSNNWLDELDGEDDEALRQSLENDKLSFSEGGRTKGSSGSDVVVSMCDRL